MNIRYFYRYKIVMACAICALSGCSSKLEDSDADQVASSASGAGIMPGVSQDTSPAQTVTANAASGAASPENYSAHMSPEQVKQDLPSNADNERLILEYISKKDGVFTEGYLDLKGVTCTDKSVQGIQMTAICNVTVKVNQGYAMDSSIARQYGIIGVGDTATVEKEYRFEKFESGWKLRPSLYP